MKEDNPERAAIHEAGGAVMRWVLGLPATDMTLTRDGNFGAGQAMAADDYLLVLLAGPAVACGYNMLNEVDVRLNRTGDFQMATRLLNDHEWLRVPGVNGKTHLLNVEDAVDFHFQRACDQLWPHADLIESLRSRIEETGRVSARSVAALCCEYEKRRR